MDRLPALTARQVVRALKRAGFVEDRQKGSHLILIHSELKRRVIVPIHRGKTIRQGLLYGIVAEAGLSRDEFLGLL